MLARRQNAGLNTNGAVPVELDRDEREAYAHDDLGDSQKGGQCQTSPSIHWRGAMDTGFHRSFAPVLWCQVR